MRLCRLPRPRAVLTRCRSQPATSLAPPRRLAETTSAQRQVAMISFTAAVALTLATARTCPPIPASVCPRTGGALSRKPQVSRGMLPCLARACAGHVSLQLPGRSIRRVTTPTTRRPHVTAGQPTFQHALGICVSRPLARTPARALDHAAPHWHRSSLCRRSPRPLAPRGDCLGRFSPGRNVPICPGATHAARASCRPAAAGSAPCPLRVRARRGDGRRPALCCRRL